MRALVFALAFVTVAASSRAVPITTCGDAVPDGETGDLMNDLTCTDLASGLVGVVVGSGGTLNLNGFHIIGPGSTLTGGAPLVGISCGGTYPPSPSKPARNCQVNGPGEITNSQVGLFEIYVRRAVVNDLTLRGNGQGMIAYARRLTMTNVVADGNDGLGIGGSKIQGTGIETNNNGQGGLGGSKVELSGFTATGNGEFGGLFSLDGRGPALLTDCTITGNDGLGQGYDIVRQGHVRLGNTVCGKSVRLDYSIPNQVIGSYGCTND
jgi:hypothetical protein